MKQKRKLKKLPKIQGYALLYGRSSRAIRIVNGEVVGKKDNQKQEVPRARPIDTVVKKKQTTRGTMSKEAEQKLNRLSDPLDKFSRQSRAEKYDAVRQNEKYEYGLSDW